MRSVYIVTHTEATHHVDGLVGGWYDTALTSRGRQQAVQVADALVSTIGTAAPVGLFCSDLARARQTAEPIAATFGAGITLDSDLRERSFGAAEGRPGGPAVFTPPPAGIDRMHHRDGVEGVETRHEFASRLYRALDRVVESFASSTGPHQNTVVVTHGGVVTYLIAAWIGLPLPAAGYVKFAVSPGSITVLREDDLFHDRQVLTLGDTRHLQ